MISNAISVELSWNHQKLDLSLASESTIEDLKKKIQELTGVEAINQKLFGLVKGKIPPNDTKLTQMHLKTPVHKFFMMGTAKKDFFKQPDVFDNVINDLDSDHLMDSSPELDVENRKSLQTIVEKLKINLIAPISENKKLLVLDLDYTLFDCKSHAVNIKELIRPGTHEMLTVLSKYYEFVIWSQTSWRVSKN